MLNAVRRLGRAIKRGVSNFLHFELVSGNVRVARPDFFDSRETTREIGAEVRRQQNQDRRTSDQRE